MANSHNEYVLPIHEFFLEINVGIFCVSLVKESGYSIIFQFYCQSQLMTSKLSCTSKTIIRKLLCVS